MVKGWLDPRTQAKIEIIGPGAESLRRLKDLISPEHLPPQYGGTAKELYPAKPHTDLISVPRGGEFATSIDIPPGKTLFVDSYLGEGTIDVTVALLGGGAKPVVGQVYAKATIKIPENSQNRSERCLLSVPEQAVPRSIRVTWKNASTWNSRQLIYSLTISDTAEFTSFEDGLERSTSIEEHASKAP